MTLGREPELCECLQDGGGEIEKEEWIGGFMYDDEVYAQFAALVPYKRFFKDWQVGDTSLKPILTALTGDFCFNLADSLFVASICVFLLAVEKQ